jgi:hypothetical protein
MGWGNPNAIVSNEAGFGKLTVFDDDIGLFSLLDQPQTRVPHPSHSLRRVGLITVNRRRRMKLRGLPPFARKKAKDGHPAIN